MDNLTKTQLVLLVLLVSFMTSLVTGIVTVTLVNQAPPVLTQTIHKVIEKAIVTRDKESNKTVKVVENVIILTQEDLVIKLVNEFADAVVSVIATKDLPVIEQYFVDPFAEDDLFKQMIPQDLFSKFQVPQYRQNGTEKKEISGGTGFFVSANGLLVTNRHVVADTKADYSIVTNDGRKLSVEVLARDPLQDIAILKVEGDGYKFVPLGDSEKLRVGQTVVAIGNSLGEFQNSVSVGVISGLMRTIMTAGVVTSGPEILQEVIQTDAAINFGNSGGPLLDLNGRVIGINTAIATDAENIGFALPINIAKKDIADVKEFSKIRYAYLGVRYLMIDKKAQEERDLPIGYGALLVGNEAGNLAVIADSPADIAGLQAGDIIMEFANTKVNHDNNLTQLISKQKVGEIVKIKILRNGEEMILSAELAERLENL